MNANEPASFDRQYSALRTGCGIVELADWSSVTLNGADRQTFLNNFCTNEVKRLTPGESCEAFFTNVKGKIIAHGLVTCRTDELVIVGPPAQGALLATNLDRYVIREDVTVRDTTAERAYLFAAVSNGSQSLDFPIWRLIDVEFAYLVERPRTDARKRIDALVGCGWVACDQEVFHTLRIEAGTPLFGIDFDDHNFPQEVGRNAQAISFTKGCYLGQETVARIDALGHVNQQIVGVAFSRREVPPVGTELTHNGANVGRVTSATYSPGLQRPLAMAMVRREHHAVGSRLESPIGLCEVVSLPL